MSRTSSTWGLAGIVAIAIVALLAFVPIAPAKDAATGQVAAVSNAAPSASNADGSTIPFSGLDAALLLSGAIVLVGAGAAIARLVPRTEEL